MDVKVCKNCRRLFKYMFGPELCPECQKQLSVEKKEPVMKEKNELIRQIAREEVSQYEQVKDYIMANPRATVAEIAEANNIPPTKLFEWIKEDRLEFSDDSEYAWFLCEKCGTKIKSGRMCNRCKTK